MLDTHSDIKVGVIGLGSVGLPLAVEFGKKYPTLGFDISTKRVNELIQGMSLLWRLPQTNYLIRLI